MRRFWRRKTKDQTRFSGVVFFMEERENSARECITLSGPKSQKKGLIPHRQDETMFSKESNVRRGRGTWSKNKDLRPR